MPVYQYACPDCGHQFERQQKFTDDKIKVCPNCHKRHIHRVVGQVSVAFRGSGFYVNDSRGSNPAGVKPKTPDSKSAEGAGAEPSSSEAKGSTPAESKTEGKAETKTESKSDSPAPADKKPSSGDVKK